MAIDANDIYRVRLIWLLEEQVCYNILHRRAKTAATGTTGENQMLDDMLDQAENIVTAILADAPAALECMGVDTAFIHGTGDDHFRERTLALAGGDAVSEPLPGFVAGVLNHNTGRRSRSRRGRSHIPGLSEKHTDGGRLTVDGETHMTNVGVAFANSMTISYTVACVWSPTLAAQGDPEPWTDHVGYEWSELVGSMDTRKIGVGS